MSRTRSKVNGNGNGNGHFIAKIHSLVAALILILFSIFCRWKKYPLQFAISGVPSKPTFQLVLILDVV